MEFMVTGPLVGSDDASAARIRGDELFYIRDFC